MKIIGIQRVDYTNKNGYHVLGYKLHTATPFDKVRSDCIGEYVESFFVSDRVFGQHDSVAIGDKISIAYNKFGKIVGFSIID